MNPVKRIIAISTRHQGMSAPFKNDGLQKSPNQIPFYGLVAAALAGGGALAYYRPFSHKASSNEGKLEKAKEEGAKEQGKEETKAPGKNQANPQQGQKGGPGTATPSSGQAPRY
ncbi:unnamed protein product, partial [Mesorhabditis belari]|uniref:Uncharacterized protein n=1 Tax=Mesorhabditis belari TaxID=2138241 RepID=A0AAF3ERF3_9BILA